MTMFLVCGAGLMARALVYDLERFSNPSKIILLDVEKSRLDQISGKTVEKHCGNLADEGFVEPFFEKADVACGAASYKLNLQLTRLAIEGKTHFVDMGGNNSVVESQFGLSRQAAEAGVTIIPDCGLAPGMASVLVADGVVRFDRVESIKIRVGGLPQHPEPPLGYAVFFSPEGLLNEYREPTVVLRNGKIRKLSSLTEGEKLSFPPNFPELEAFHTSGGASTLPKTYEDKVQSLDYKTIRYPGHFQGIKFLFDLGLADETKYDIAGVTISPDQVLRDVLFRRLPKNVPDVALVYVEVKGKLQGKPKQATYYIEDYLDPVTGHTAMQRTTAYSVGIVMQMIAEGSIHQRGTLRLETGVNPNRFIELFKLRGIGLSISTE